MTPLGAAISRGNYTAVKTLLEHSSQINCDQNRGYFLLRTAIYKNSTGIPIMIISIKLNILKYIYYKCLLLKFIFLEIVELLIQHNSATKEQTTDEESGSLLHVACDLGNADIAKLLVDRGKIEINIEDKWKIRPVHVAAAKGRLNILKYLHDQGADLNAEDVFGNTPLGWAVFCKSLDCETYLKNFNAKYKDFVVPPPPDAESAKSVNEVSETTIEQLELETDGKKDIKKINNKTSIPVRKTVSTMVTKIEGATNPSFQMGDEKKEVTTV